VGKKRGSKPSFPKMLLWALGMLLFGVLVALSIQHGCKTKSRGEAIPATQPPPDVQPAEKPSPDTAKKPAPLDAVKPTMPAPARSEPPRIALVIDDLGQADPALVSRLCSLNIPLTVAVLPFLPHSRESAGIAHSKGKEVILHMPMEPIGYPGPGKNPGPGAILFGLDETEVRRRVAAAMEEIPHAVGMNNHMGSRITHDRARMSWILEEVKKRGWYFLDSRTEKDTVALEVARELGIPALERKVFLDDSLDPGEMSRQWERAMALAKNEGEAAMIGHIHLETIAFLEKTLKVPPSGIAFVKASELARL
jgi:polysaccharide deacetylase 2 family uncharacterized protein YibQ